MGLLGELGHLKDFLVPSGCFICGKSLEGKKIVCRECLSDNFSLPLLFLEGIPLYSLFKYNEKTKSFYLSLKKQEISLDILEEILNFSPKWKEGISKLKIDFLLAVPSRSSDFPIRIAKILSRNLSLPLENNILKSRKIIPQKYRGKKRREENIRNSFVFDKKKLVETVRKYCYNSRGCEVIKVLIVDDIVTTGATLKEVKRILAQKGIETGAFFTIARRED